ncbi:MAG: VOC family protein [Pseudomonadota bacterium]
MNRIAACAFATLSLLACSEQPDPANNVIDGISFVGLTVSDIDQSAALYSQAADLRTVSEEDDAYASMEAIAPILDLVGDESIGVKTRMLRSSNAQLRLMQFDSPSTAADPDGAVPVNGPGIAHVCFQVVDDTQTYQKLLAGGATPIGDAEMVQLNPRNPVQYAYALDPDGIMVEVEHIDITELELDEPPKNNYRIRHVSLATPDIDRAVDFYSVLLNDPDPRRAGTLIKLSGENIDRVSGLPDSEIEMAWFQTRNLELELIQYHSHPTTLPDAPRPVNALGYNMIVFDAPDIDAARKRLLEAGGTIASEVAAMDGGEILFGRDPDGNLLGFQTVDATALVSSQHFKDNGL